MKELKSRLREVERDRASYIIRLGEASYAELRGVVGESRDDIVQELRRLDRSIYDLKKTIKLKELDKSGLKCSKCNESISPEDKFCNSCGAGITSLEDKEALFDCKVCGAGIFEGDVFCASCGNRA